VSPADVLLRVTATGDVEMASLRRGSNCAPFNDVALATARDLSFTPGRKGDAPVPAWIVLQIRPARR
jgi:TonB family protein